MAEQLAAMPDKFEKLNSKIERAVAERKLIEPAAKNIQALLAGARSDLYLRAVTELIDTGEWQELNDRFYRTLSFGTGGLRGRTIGKIVTAAERGTRAKANDLHFRVSAQTRRTSSTSVARRGTCCVSARLECPRENRGETETRDRA